MSETSFIYRSPLGPLLIKASGESVSAVLFSKFDPLSPAVNHSTEMTTSSHPLIQKCVEQLTSYFDGTRKQFDLPLHQPGTPFQQKVWSELEKIEYGKTIIRRISKITLYYFCNLYFITAHLDHIRVNSCNSWQIEQLYTNLPVAGTSLKMLQAIPTMHALRAYSKLMTLLLPILLRLAMK